MLTVLTCYRSSRMKKQKREEKNTIATESRTCLIWIFAIQKIHLL